MSLQFSFTENALEIRDRFQRVYSFSFEEKNKLGLGLFSGHLWLKGAEGCVGFADVKEEEQKTVLLEFLRRYKSRSPDLARKTAFDYVDAQKGFLKIAFITGLFFFLPFGIALLNDSREQYFCGKELHEESAVGQMQVTKVSKKRKGHYILTLEMPLPNGDTVKGMDQMITLDETTIPKFVPVIFSPRNPHCWSLPSNFAQSEPNWAKQRYFAAFTLLFGLFFLGCALAGCAWSILRWREKRPYQKEIRELFLLES